MMTPKEIPSRADLVDYNYAVAGHAGTLCDPDGELFIKPCTQAELDFYQSAAEEHPAFADLMPIFMGSLLLNDATNVASIDEQLPVVADHISPEMKEQMIELMAEKSHKKEAAPSPAPKAATAPAASPAPGGDGRGWVPSKGKKIVTDTAVVLENAAFGFHRPNILDVKLGKRLWADDAPLAKKQRFDRITAETTHGDLGFRIAGMRVYKGSADPADLDAEGYRIYDKDYGRVHVDSDNVADAFRRFIFNEAAGVDPDVGRAVAAAFRRDLEHVRDVLEREESRMYSSSLLFVFEGDGAALRAAVDESNAAVDKEEEEPGRCTLRVDSGIGMTADGEIVLSGECGAGGDGDDLDDLDDDEDDERPEPHIYTLKLIDFAHARWTPGLGPDENTLAGVRSLIDIFGELAK